MSFAGDLAHSAACCAVFALYNWVLALLKNNAGFVPSWGAGIALLSLLFRQRALGTDASCAAEDAAGATLGRSALVAALANAWGWQVVSQLVRRAHHVLRMGRASRSCPRDLEKLSARPAGEPRLADSATTSTHLDRLERLQGSGWQRPKAALQRASVRLAHNLTSTT